MFRPLSRNVGHKLRLNMRRRFLSTSNILGKQPSKHVKMSEQFTVRRLEQHVGHHETPSELCLLSTTREIRHGTSTGYVVSPTRLLQNRVPRVLRYPTFISNRSLLYLRGEQRVRPYIFRRTINQLVCFLFHLTYRNHGSRN